MNGVLNLFKEKNMTSHDAVAIIRKIFNTKKVGHSGTLDPNVTGVLPICIGRATKIADYLHDAGKAYIGEVTFGAKTDTGDSYGNIVSRKPITWNEDLIREVFESFKGPMEQTAPIYSAKKIDGMKLYEYARKGIKVDIKPHSINIYDLNIININRAKHSVIYEIKCSKGTYIRKICEDLAEKTGNEGYMSYLIRTQSAGLVVDDSISIDRLKKMKAEDLSKTLIPMDKALSNIENLFLDENHFQRIINGVKIPLDESYRKYNSFIKVYCGEKFIGLGHIINKDDARILKMDKILYIGD